MLGKEGIKTESWGEREGEEAAGRGGREKKLGGNGRFEKGRRDDYDVMRMGEI